MRRVARFCTLSKSGFGGSRSIDQYGILERLLENVDDIHGGCRAVTAIPAEGNIISYLWMQCMPESSEMWLEGVEVRRDVWKDQEFEVMGHVTVFQMSKDRKRRLL